MSFLNSSRQRLERVKQFVVSLPTRMENLFSLRNLKVLLKAIRQEPPDLIYENLLQFFRRSPGQSVYTGKFRQEDAQFKVYVIECRREAGVLKVMVWILARSEMTRIEICSMTNSLPAQAARFIKPELYSFFAGFSDYKQIGYLFQVPFFGELGEIKLRLRDKEEHQLMVAIGDLFQDSLKVPADHGLHRTIPTHGKLLVVLHDWGADRLNDNINLEKYLALLAGLRTNLVICTRKPLHVPVTQGLTFLDYFELNEFLRTSILEGITHMILLDLGADLSIDFIDSIAHYVERQPDTGILYFDEDLQSAKGHRHSPTRKPAYSPEYLAADNYIGSNFCISVELGRQLGWFTPLDFRSGAYHFLLRAMETKAVFCRLPETLVHRPERGAAYFSSKEAAEMHVRTTHFSARGAVVNPGLVPGSGEVLLPISGRPLVSIIIPFKDQLPLLEQCLNSIFDRTEYPNFEVLLISNNSQEAATYEYLEKIVLQYSNVRWYRRDHPFNFSQLNNWAVQQANGTFLLLLNNDVELITRGWISKLLSYFMEEGVGAVGVKLLYPDHTVQHAGIITGIGGIAGHAHKHYPDTFGGYEGRANKVQNLTACTAACLMVRRSAYEQVDGMDEENLPVAFNDVDLCLKIHQAGYRIVYTPFVKLYHYESISRGAEDSPTKRKRAKREIHFFRRKWRSFIKAGDPYYHPQLSNRMADFEDRSIMGI